MPIQVISDGKRSGPVAICDGCLEKVTHSEDGNALWIEVKQGKNLVVDPRIFITHKRCNRAFERRISNPPDSQVMAEELDVFLARLVSNVGITLESAMRTKQKMNLLDSIE
jgi:hypothetical protein